MSRRLSELICRWSGHCAGRDGLRELISYRWFGYTVNSNCLVSKHLPFILAVVAYLLDSRSVFRANRERKREKWKLNGRKLTLSLSLSERWLFFSKLLYYLCELKKRDVVGSGATLFEKFIEKTSNGIFGVMSSTQTFVLTVKDMM